MTTDSDADHDVSISEMTIRDSRSLRSLSRPSLERALSQPLISSKSAEKRGYSLFSLARLPANIFLVTFFLPYLTLLAQHATNDQDRIEFLGIAALHIQPTSLAQLVLMCAAFVTMIAGPLFGAIGDSTSYRRPLLKITAYCTGIAFAGLVSVFPATWWLGPILLFCIIVFTQISDVLMNSYVPEMADTPEERSHLSANAAKWGFGSQFVFSLLLVAVMALFDTPKLSISGGQLERSTDTKFFTFIPTTSSTILPKTFDPATRPLCTVDQSACQIEFAGSASYALKLSSSGIIGISMKAKTFMSQKDIKSLAGREIWFKVVARTESHSAKLALRIWASVSGNKVISIIEDDWNQIKHPTNGKRAPQLFRKSIVLPPGTTKLYYEVHVSNADMHSPVYIDRVEVLDSAKTLVPFLSLLAGLWVVYFTWRSTRKMGDRIRNHNAVARSAKVIVFKSVKELFVTIRKTAKDSCLSRSLLATSLYTAGVSSILTTATTYFSNVLELTEIQLALCLIVTICTSLIGAMVSFLIGKRIGFSRMLSFCYLIWAFNVFLMWALLTDADAKPYLFLIVPMMGLATGGTAALQRSVFASMIPSGQECELYGLFSFAMVVLSPFALLVMFVVAELSKSQSLAMLSMATFVCIAFALQFSLSEEDVNKRAADLQNVRKASIVFDRTFLPDEMIIEADDDAAVPNIDALIDDPFDMSASDPVRTMSSTV